jgi:high-affinity iron transporter
MLTYMILWMQRQARTLKADLHGRMESALGSGSGLAIATLAFTVVVREGLETVIFLAAGAGTADSPGAYLAGALIGLAAATLLGYLLYRGTLRINLRLFFTATGWLLIIFAAGMIANGCKELHEAGVLPRVVSHVWDTYRLLPDTTAFGRFMGALFGYDAAPSLTQVVGYFGYLALAGAAFLAGSRSRTVRS